MSKSHSLEEYLKTIYVLEQETGQVRVTDIATKKGCSKPSVNHALKALDSQGFLQYEAYGKIHLTENRKTSSGENSKNRNGAESLFNASTRSARRNCKQRSRTYEICSFGRYGTKARNLY